MKRNTQQDCWNRSFKPLCSSCSSDGLPERCSIFAQFILFRSKPYSMSVCISKCNFNCPHYDNSEVTKVSSWMAFWSAHFVLYSFQFFLLSLPHFHSSQISNEYRVPMLCWHLNNKGQKCRNGVFGTDASSTPSIWCAHSLECSTVIWGLILCLRFTQLTRPLSLYPKLACVYLSAVTGA